MVKISHEKRQGTDPQAGQAVGTALALTLDAAACSGKTRGPL
jgi:hypothetical protein